MTDTIEMVLGIIVLGLILANATHFVTAINAVGKVFTQAVNSLASVAGQKVG